MDGEPSLDIIDQTEVLSSLLDLNNVHEAGGELGVSPDLTVDLKYKNNLYHLIYGETDMRNVSMAFSVVIK